MKKTDQDILYEIRELALGVLQKKLNNSEKISISDLGDHCLITLSVKVSKKEGFKNLSFETLSDEY